MTAAEKRAQVIAAYGILLGRNLYSQPRRNYCYKKYKDGKYYSDCSSSVSYAYRQAGQSFGILNTVGMYNSKKLKTVEVEIKNGLPTDMGALRPGDLFLFAGTDKSRASAGYVGHVEMVEKVGATAAASTLFGHGGSRPARHNMADYCKSRQAAKTGTKHGNKGLIRVMRFIQDDGAAVRVTGGSVNIRTEPNIQGKVLGTVHRGDVLEWTGQARDGWHGVVYRGVSAWISGKYSEVTA